MAKTTTKIPKVKKEKCVRKEVGEKLKKAADEVMEKLNGLKKKFNDADPETKKKIVAGISAAAAGLVALAGLKKHKKKK